MSWKCPQCGVEGIDDSLTRHTIEQGGCGYVRLPAGITLVSERTGKELSVRIATTLGQAALRSLGDEEGRFVSTEQIRISRNDSSACWIVENLASATNPMFLNGAPIDGAGQALNDGDRLAIKGEKCPMLVKVIR